MNRRNVTVCIVTYNHARFIRHAVESVIMQEANFDFEVVIGDDCSTDGTTEIIRELAAQYPHAIRALFATTNLGASTNFRNTLAACLAGEYIAILEGDDFWTDRSKLQRQVDSLRECQDRTAVGNAVDLLIDSTGEFANASIVGYLSRSDSVERAWDPLDWPRLRPATGSLVLRRDVCEELLGQRFAETQLIDAVILLLAAQRGTIWYLPQIMGVYRTHGGGIWSSATREQHIYRTLDTVTALIDRQVYRTPAVLNWLQRVFDYNVICVAETTRDWGHFWNGLTTGVRHDLERFSSNPWGLEASCRAIVKKNLEIQALENSHSFRIGNRIVNTLKFFQRAFSRN